MKKLTARERLLASTIVGGALVALYAAPAMAQSADNTVKEVVVTGSRIPRPNLTSTSPISVVSDQEVKLTGTNDVSDLLNDLPQVTVDYNNTPNPLNGAGGITTVDLRGLGSSRTLVLMDGRRLAPGDPNVPVADLDTIPTLLVDHIELVTGGASAVYGSDALAGVVNFVMKKNFEGLRIDGQYTFFQNDGMSGKADSLIDAARAAGKVGPLPASNPSSFSGGPQTSVSVVFGANSPDGKGNVTGYMSFRHADAIYQRSYDYSSCFINGSKCTGSSNSNLIFDTYGNTTYSVNPTAQKFVPYGTTAGIFPTQKFNSNQFETLARQDQRYQGGLFAHYQVTPWFDAYGQFSFMNDKTQNQAAPSAIFQQNTPGNAPNGGFLVNCNNPLLSAQEVNLICTGNGLGPNDNADLIIGRRNVEGGPRHYSYEHNTFRALVGGKGDFADGVWHYDVYGQFGYTRLDQGVTNDLSIPRIANALQVVQTANGPQCVSKVNGTDTNCVPYNIFSGAPSAAALGYIADAGGSSGDVQEQIVSGNLTGDLGKYGLKSPYAHSGLGLSLGAEYRRDALNYVPDQESLSGNLAGAGGASPAVHGAYDVKELYGELRAPLVEDAPFAKELSFEGGYRYSEYSLSGHVKSYKAALEWQIVDDIRLRGSFQRAVRAPNVNELFTPNTVTNSTYEDNCTSGNYVASATNLTACERTGLTAAQVGHVLDCPAGQCAVETGGNAALKPEDSDTKSYGFVFTPTFFHGFNLAVDYYDIDVKGAVGVVPAQLAFSQCELTGSATFCGLIKRAPNTGILFGSTVAGGGYIQQTNANIGFLHTQGFDFESNYRVRLSDWGMGDHGALSFNVQGTYTQHFIVDPLPGQPAYDCAGLYGTTCGVPGPKWRTNARVTWATPWNVDASLRWRYIGGTSLDSNTSQPGLTNHKTDSFDASIPAYSYFDLSATWRFRPNMQLRAGVNNLFDKQPPVLNESVVGIGAPNTYNSYDILGRTIFVGLTADF